MLAFALVGCGRISRLHVKELRAHPEARIVALADAVPGAPEALIKETFLEKVQVYSSTSELLRREKGLDGVLVATPDHTHRAVVLEALEAKLPVLCEKPLSVTADEAQPMAEAARKAGVINAVHLSKRYTPAMQYMRRQIESGKAGVVRHVRGRQAVQRISNPDVKLEWRLRRETGGYGALSDLGIHLIDNALYALGFDETRVTEATGLEAVFIGERVDPETGRRGQVTAPDAAAFALRFSNGALGHFEVTRFGAGADEFSVDASRVTLRADTVANTVEEYWHEVTDHQMAQSSFRAVDLKGEQSPGVFYRFVEAVRTARPMRPDFTDGLRLMRILDKIHEACESGRRVAVEG